MPSSSAQRFMTAASAFTNSPAWRIGTSKAKLAKHWRTAHHLVGHLRTELTDRKWRWMIREAAANRSVRVRARKGLQCKK